MSKAERIHAITGEIRANVQSVREESVARITGDRWDIGFVGEVIGAMAANMLRVADALDELVEDKG